MFSLPWNWHMTLAIWNLRGLLGLLPLFILNFLQDRYFHVCVGIVLSVYYHQENRVSQGSIKSMTLFAFAISEIVNTVGPSVSTLVYVDVAILCGSQSIDINKASVTLGSEEWVFLLYI
jgi:hypothetical protein